MGIGTEVKKNETTETNSDLQELDEIHSKFNQSTQKIDVLLSNQKKRLDIYSMISKGTPLINDEYILLSKKEFLDLNNRSSHTESIMKFNKYRFEIAIEILYHQFDDSILDWEDDDWFCILFKEEKHIVNLESKLPPPHHVNYCYILTKNNISQRLIKSRKEHETLTFPINTSAYGFVFDKISIANNIIINNISPDIFIDINELFNIINNDLTESINIATNSIQEVKNKTNQVLDNKTNQLKEIGEHKEQQLNDIKRLSKNKQQELDYLQTLKDDENEINKRLLDIRIEYRKLIEKNSKLKQEKTTITKLIENEQISHNNLQEKINCVNLEIKQKQLDLDNIKEKISKEISEADKFTLDLNGHMKESRVQRYYYFAFSILIAIFLTFISSKIYERANDLLGHFLTEKNVNMWQVLLSRLPLITISTLMICSLSALLYFSVNHILSLNKDRMNMLKASILAEQISISLKHDFDLSREDRLEQSKKLKVEIIMKLFENQKTPMKLNLKNMSVLTQAIDTALKLKK
ncbi:hypothetical protein [uncultured Shewanella sp.]|uniref:hypothetical protein n=1 Tax=uncultured Shewanella sp. TaxID=173975 RepID=UPI002611B9EA|nr:hypothetical protein [uncultured Shewanella sp.]